MPSSTISMMSSLIALYGGVMAKLLERDIVHSGNHPIADIAEKLVADLYGVEQAPPNEKAVDVVTRDGTRIQALRKTKPGRSRL